MTKILSLFSHCYCFGYKASVLCLPPIIPEFPWRPRAALATVWLGASSSYWHYRVNSECDRRGVVTATNCFNCSSSPSRQYYSGKSPVSSGPMRWSLMNRRWEQSLWLLHTLCVLHRGFQTTYPNKQNNINPPFQLQPQYTTTKKSQN